MAAATGICSRTRSSQPTEDRKRVNRALPLLAPIARETLTLQSIRNTPEEVEAVLREMRAVV